MPPVEWGRFFEKAYDDPQQSKYGAKERGPEGRRRIRTIRVFIQPDRLVESQCFVE